MCSKLQKCLSNISVVENDCTVGCDGLSITSFIKTPFSEKAASSFWEKVKHNYNAYQNNPELDENKYKGIHHMILSINNIVTHIST